MQIYSLQYLFIYLILCRESNRFSASQEIPRVLLNQNIQYRFYKCPPSVPVLSQISAYVPTIPFPWRFISILSSNLRPGLPSGLPTKTLHTPVLSPIHATCPVHLILLDLITRIIFGEEYRSLNSSLCTSLHSPVTSSLLEPNILLCTLSSNTLKLRSSLKFHAHTK